MFFDALTAAAVADELRDGILGGFVQKTVLPDPQSLALEVYRAGARHHLLVTIQPEHPRALLVAERPTAQPGLVTPLGLLVRKHILDGVVTEVHQPAGERTIALSIAKRPEGNNTVVWLVAELMGRHSNVILLNEDRTTVLESMKRVPLSLSRTRPILPRHPYAPPPPRPGIQAHHVTPELLQGACSPRDSLLSQALVSAVAGLSPLAAREVIHRAGGDPAIPADKWQDWPSLATAAMDLASLWSTRRWEPSVARAGNGTAAYAPYRLTHLESSHTVEPAASISAAIREYAGKPVHLVEHGQIRDSLLSALGEHERKLQARLESLESQQRRAGEAEELMQSGQLVLAYSWQIKPGDRVLQLDDRSISLDPALTPSENAERMFDGYRRRQRAAAELPRLVAEAREQIEAVQEFRLFVEMAEGHAALSSLQAEAREAGLIPGRITARSGRGPRTAQPLKLTSPEGIQVLVGRSAGQNERVLELGSPDDWWFHARDIPGGHVVARTGGKEPSGATLGMAAQAAAYYSAGRESGKVEVVCCQLKHVRKVKGGPSGRVTYRNEKTLLASPAAPGRAE